MIAYSAGSYTVITAGPRAFAILDTRSSACRLVRGADAVNLAVDLINRPRRLPDAVGEVYLEGFFSRHT